MLPILHCPIILIHIIRKIHISSIASKGSILNIEGDEEAHLNLSNLQDHTNIPTTLIPSPPVIIQQEDEPPQRKQSPVVADEIMSIILKKKKIVSISILQMKPRKLISPKKTMNGGNGQLLNRRGQEGPLVSVMDYEQTVIPGQMYQSWLQDASDLIRVRKRKQPRFVDPLNVTAMACPAMPLCTLAITEAERGIPAIRKRIRVVFEKKRYYEWIGLN